MALTRSSSSRVLAFLLVTTSSGLVAANSRAATGCTRDSECKGARICENGRCVNPAPAAGAPTPSETVSPGSADASAAATAPIPQPLAPPPPTPIPQLQAPAPLAPIPQPQATAPTEPQSAPETDGAETSAKQLFGAGRFAEAAAEFDRAYRATCDPSFLFNIALCYRRLGDLGRALPFYQEYLRRAPDSPRRADVEARIQQIQAELASTGGAGSAGTSTPAMVPPTCATTTPGPAASYPAQWQPSALSVNGSDVPPGFHEERYVRKGFVIPGAALTGGLYLLGLALMAKQTTDGGNPAGYLAIPIIGPWIALQQLDGYDEAACERQNTDSGKVCPSKEGAKSGYALLGVGQLAGIGLIVVGIVAKRTEIVPNAVTSHHVTVAPFYAGARPAGLVLAGSF
jgi:hypothetical protein